MYVPSPLPNVHSQLMPAGQRTELLELFTQLEAGLGHRLAKGVRPVIMCVALVYRYDQRTSATKITRAAIRWAPRKTLSIRSTPCRQRSGRDMSPEFKSHVGRRQWCSCGLERRSRCRHFSSNLEPAAASACASGCRQYHQPRPTAALLRECLWTGWGTLRRSQTQRLCLHYAYRCSPRDTATRPALAVSCGIWCRCEQ